MKKVYLLMFGLFSLILGFSSVNASEYFVYNFGADSCLDSDNNVSYSCILNSNGELSYTTYNIQVTPFILSIDEFDYYNDSNSKKYACFYTSSYVFISCQDATNKSTTTIISPDNAYFMRLSYGNHTDSIIYDDTNVSSLSVLSNSISHLIEYVIDLITSATIILYIVLGITITLVLVGVVKWLRS